MGAVCSGGTSKKRSVDSQSLKKKKTKKKDSFSKPKEAPISYVPERIPHGFDHEDDRLLQFSSELKPSTPARIGVSKAGQKSSVIGRAGILGFEKAVDVLDTLGSSMSNFNSNSGFVHGIASKGNKITILAFEVANTVVKGSNLLQSVSEESIQYLKKDVLNSQGVKILVSADMNELLAIAASDKRQELEVFSREVIRFGDLCKDPQWHNLGRFFSGLDSDDSSQRQTKEETEMKMHELIILAQHTSELYHEFNALDRFQQDYRQKVEEVEALNLPRRGESLKILQSELKHQRKLVRSLRKKSLWSKTLEEVVEKLVDVIIYANQAITEAFSNPGSVIRSDKGKDYQRLGVAGLALHYANVINQIDNIASRPNSLPPNTRDTLYHGLPKGVKAALRSRLNTLDTKEHLSVAKIKSEMEKSLQWLVPFATNTNRAHQGFGWVGEWANAGPEFGKSSNTQNSTIRLQTLYHADKQKTDSLILDLVIWLQHLICVVRHRDIGLKPLPERSPTRKGLDLHSKMQQYVSIDLTTEPRKIQLSSEDRDLLNEVIGRRKRILGASKSQEFVIVKKKRDSRVWALSKSTGSSPNRGTGSKRSLESYLTNFLDVIDGLDSAI